jgi:hypothetical protein
MKHVISGVTGLMLVLVAGWVRRVDRRGRRAAVKAALAERLGWAAHTRLDLHADALTPAATSVKPPTRLRLSVVTRDV